MSPCFFTNRTSLELKSLLSLFCFPPKLGLSNWGCGLYIDFYGILVLKEVFVERETKVFALQRYKKFLVCKT